MNERIKDLYLNSLDDKQNFCYQKFAELIVQECAQVAHNKQYKHSPAHTVGDCATAIKEHFGVEE